MLGVFADIIKDQLDRKFIEQVPSGAGWSHTYGGDCSQDSQCCIWCHEWST
jgi:hypothetical protein